MNESICTASINALRSAASRLTWAAVPVENNGVKRQWCAASRSRQRHAGTHACSAPARLLLWCVGTACRPLMWVSSGRGGRRPPPRLTCYQEQQQLPPPHVVLAPGATVTVRPPVAVLPTWPEKLNIAQSSPSATRRKPSRLHIDGCLTVSMNVNVEVESDLNFARTNRTTGDNGDRLNFIIPDDRTMAAWSPRRPGAHVESVEFGPAGGRVGVLLPRVGAQRPCGSAHRSGCVQRQPPRHDM
jgi:hypothetical protein